MYIYIYMIYICVLYIYIYTDMRCIYIYIPSLLSSCFAKPENMGGLHSSQPTWKNISMEPWHGEMVQIFMALIQVAMKIVQCLQQHPEERLRCSFLKGLARPGLLRGSHIFHLSSTWKNTPQRSKMFEFKRQKLTKMVCLKLMASKRGHRTGFTIFFSPCLWS